MPHGSRQHGRRPRPDLARLERLRHRLGHRPGQLSDAGGDVLRRHHRHRSAQQHSGSPRSPVRPPTTATAPAFRPAPPASLPAASAPTRPARPTRILTAPVPCARALAAASANLARESVAAAPPAPRPTPPAGCPDGYKALTTAPGAVWQHGITVWRNNNYTPVFDTSYQYTFSASSPRQPDGRRRRQLADSAVEPVGRARAPRSSTWPRAAATGPSRR